MQFSPLNIRLLDDKLLFTVVFDNVFHKLMSLEISWILLERLVANVSQVFMSVSGYELSTYIPVIVRVFRKTYEIINCILSYNVIFYNFLLDIDSFILP